MKVALLAGSTGLIGSQLLSLLLQDGKYQKIKVLSRKPLEEQHPSVENIVLDFDRLEDRSSELVCDDIFCCLGTTMKQAGSKEAFRKVDYHYPAQLATITKQLGATQYLLVSALGADKKSSVFYNRVKGEVEEVIEATGFRSFHIFRPSLLMGPRSEKRTGEDAAKWFFRYFGFLVPKKYSAIDSLKVAKAMLHSPVCNKRELMFMSRWNYRNSSSCLTFGLLPLSILVLILSLPKGVGI